VQVEYIIVSLGMTDYPLVDGVRVTRPVF